jgi:hypothetical protein
MKKLITSSVLVLTLTTCALPAFAGQSNGGKQYVPGGEVILGGQSNGGMPFIGGGMFSTSGFGDPSMAGAGMYVSGTDPTSYVAPNSWFGRGFIVTLFDYLFSPSYAFF